MRGMISSASCHISRDCATSTSKPACSNWLERPVPNSTRPPDTRSSIATRSATRIGWLNRFGSSTTPWPIRMRFVRCAAAARKTSGAEQWANSCRKWCSTAQTVSKPRRSASSICSSASCTQRYSLRASWGFGIWSS